MRPESDRRGAAFEHAARVAHRQAPLAGLQIGRFAQFDVRVVAGVGDLGHANVARAIGAQGDGLRAPAVGKDRDQLGVRLTQHVAHRQDQPLSADHNAAAVAQDVGRDHVRVDDADDGRQDMVDRRATLFLGSLEFGNVRFAGQKQPCRQQAYDCQPEGTPAGGRTRESLDRDRAAGHDVLILLLEGGGGVLSLARHNST